MAVVMGLYRYAKGASFRLSSIETKAALFLSGAG
jgi:hypothetical protein